jgi:Domain of unknown function (DUF4258)
MRAIARIREAIRQQRYRVSSHANEEMSEDDLEAVDVEQIILTGRIVRRYTRDPRGTRYEVVGQTTDQRQAAVVCRFLPSSVLLIVMAYADE